MHQSLLHAIGNTPLVQLNFDSLGSVFAKLEYLNPGGSVKDRSALFMIELAEKQGFLKPGGTIIEASSGNQGIATAMIGALKGYNVIITVSEKISLEKLNTIKAYGAQVIVCPSTQFIDDPHSYHAVALNLHKNTPNSFMPNQYFNIDNALAHYSLLGPEIWKQTNGKITHFFAGTGSGGTITGVGKYLKEQNPAIKVIGIDAATSYRSTNGNPKPYKIEGLGVDFESPVINYNVIDEMITITDSNALNMLKVLARNHAILAGPTSGAVAYVAQQYASQLSKNNLAVAIFGDSGRAYLTKDFYNN